MKNIYAIFLKDIKKIRTNVIAMIVVMGVSIVPCLYAWFNIAASWDPYSNTRGISIAVANTDQGYQGELLPLDLNLGENIVSALHANEQMNWTFTDKETAIEGVKSGKYYAAIVIPQEFSSDMLSLFSSQLQKPRLLYYINEKENAIAPKVTDKGASAILQQINEMFIQTASKITLDALQSVSAVTDSEASSTLQANLQNNLETICEDLSSSSASLYAFANMIHSMQQLLDTTSDFLAQTSASSDSSLSDLGNLNEGTGHIQTTLETASDAMNQVFAQSTDFYSSVSESVDDTFQKFSSDTGDLSLSLSQLSDKVQILIDRYTQFRDDLQIISDAIPDEIDLIAPIIGNINSVISRQEAFRDKLSQLSDKITEDTKQSQSYQTELETLIQENLDAFSKLQTDYETNLDGNLADLFTSLDNTSEELATFAAQLTKNTSDLTTLADSSSENLNQAETTLRNSAELLSNASKKLSLVNTQKLSLLQDSGIPLDLLLKDSASHTAGLLASPVSLVTQKLYPVENYGSAMTPFYSTLAMWVGGIILVAMIQVSVSPNTLTGLKKVRQHQIYLGRFLIFFILGIVQSTLICLGNLYFLEIQCEHPFLFVLSGWVTSLVYVSIIYALTVSFGDVGKAICVILLVVQVAGSGGTFPIEMTPAFFQTVYPLLPFTHSMAAMRECIAGFYENTYWVQLGNLLLYLIPALLLGLLLRKPVIRLNHAFMEKLENTHLM